MKLLALLSSMPFESDKIRAKMGNIRRIRLAGKTAYKGKISGIDIILLNTGIGKVNAAHSASCILELFPVGSLINLGVGGAYPGSGIGNGDIAIASTEILGDEGVIDSKGWKPMTEIGIPLVQKGKKKYFNEYPLENRLFKKTLKSLSSGAAQVSHGPFVTLSAASGSRARAEKLEERFKGICENMEGAAIAQVCVIYKIPFLEIRGISNIAGIRDRRKWDLKLASGNCQKAVLEIIKNIFRNASTQDVPPNR